MPRPASILTGILRNQDELAGRPAAFEVVVGLGGVFEGVGAADADVEVALADPGEQALRPPEELLAVAGVLGERRAGDVEAALLIQDLRVEGGDLPAGPAPVPVCCLLFLPLSSGPVSCRRKLSLDSAAARCPGP